MFAKLIAARLKKPYVWTTWVCTEYHVYREGAIRLTKQTFKNIDAAVEYVQALKLVNPDAVIMLERVVKEGVKLGRLS